MSGVLFCRECSEGKHVNCDGTAWSNELDAPTRCTCPDGSHATSAEIVAHIWREHSNCNWKSTGVNVMWSCGIWHEGPIHMQPTTRDKHVAALVMTQVEADREIQRRRFNERLLNAARSRTHSAEPTQNTRVLPPGGGA